MDKLNYLKEGKNLVRGIIAQRRWLVQHRKGHIDPKFAEQQIRNMQYALSQIKSADRMQQYIERKEAELRMLIPTTNKKRMEKLRELITAQLN